MADVGDGLGQGAGDAVVGDVVDEAAVEFEFADRQLAQITQAGVAGSEVVHRQAHAQRMYLPQRAQGRGVGVEQYVFGDLQRQVRCIE
ncbi:hypothetical protein D3C71_1088000 [compost metagenome]